MTEAKAILRKNSEAKVILRAYHALTERQYKGDTDAICTLVDLADAVRLARLTDRQTEALTLVYVEDMTQRSAGERMGIGQQNVAEHVELAVSRIQAVYNEWANNETEASE